jgi:hypothetical protein
MFYWEIFVSANKSFKNMNRSTTSIFTVWSNFAATCNMFFFFSDPTIKVCMKCREQPAIVVIRVGDPFCRWVFKLYFTLLPYFQLSENYITTLHHVHSY